MDDIVAQYDIWQLSKDVWVYMEIRKFMSGLNHVVRIANERLTTHLQNYS